MKKYRGILMAAGLMVFTGPAVAGSLALEIQGQLLVHEKLVQQCAYCALPLFKAPTSVACTCLCSRIQYRRLVHYV